MKTFWSMTIDEKVEATKAIEAQIEAEIAEQTGPDYEPWTEADIRELRDWVYSQHGWGGDPWAEDEEPEEEPFNGDWYAYNGVSRWDFF